MDVVSKTAQPNSAGAKPTVRPQGRRSAQRVVAQSKAARPRWHGIVLVVLLMAGSAVVSAFLVRQRYKARQVVASVNGTIVSQDEFFGRLQQTAGAQTLRQLVDEDVLDQYARKIGVYPSEAMIAARYHELASRPGFHPSPGTDGAVRQQLVLQMVREAIVGQGTTVTDADVRRYYQQNVNPANPQARFYTPEMVQVAIIVTRTEDAARKAVQALDQGIPFATAAKTYSVDTSRDNGGVLGPSLRGRNKMGKIPGLEDTLFSLSVGQRVGPRKFAGVWWIIRCVDKQPALTLRLDQVQEEAKAGARVAKGAPNGQHALDGLAEFRRVANVQAFWPQYREALRTAR